MATYKDESRRTWATSDGKNPGFEGLQLGCMQRIADANEAMANNYVRLLDDAKWQREAKERLQKTCDRLARSNAALRGYINRLKRANEKLDSNDEHTGRPTRNGETPDANTHGKTGNCADQCRKPSDRPARRP